MSLEIEHKYIVYDDSYKGMATESHYIIQGYLSKDPERTVRIRIKDSNAFITIKGMTHHDCRLEFEYNIPLEDAGELIKLCLGTIIKKRRWIVPYRGFIWEVDEFISPNVPSLAEIELSDSTHKYPLPPFIEKEVTGDPRFYNSNL